MFVCKIYMARDVGRQDDPGLANSLPFNHVWNTDTLFSPNRQDKHQQFWDQGTSLQWINNAIMTYSLHKILLTLSEIALMLHTSPCTKSSNSCKMFPTLPIKESKEDANPLLTCSHRRKSSWMLFSCQTLYHCWTTGLRSLVFSPGHPYHSYHMPIN